MDTRVSGGFRGRRARGATAQGKKFLEKYQRHESQQFKNNMFVSLLEGNAE